MKHGVDPSIKRCDPRAILAAMQGERQGPMGFEEVRRIVSELFEEEHRAPMMSPLPMTELWLRVLRQRLRPH